MKGDKEKRKKAWKIWVKFLISLFTTILMVVTITTSPWGILKLEEKEISKFGIWTSCKQSRNDSSEVCEGFADGNIIVYSFNTEPDKVDIDYGNVVNKLCLHQRNVTVEKNVTLPDNTTVLRNVSELHLFNDCSMNHLYNRVRLERVRVFTILATVVSVLVTIMFGLSLCKEMSEFVPAVASLLVPLWFIMALSVFLSFYDKHFNLVVLEYGWCFILGWIAGGLSILNSLFALYSAFTMD